MHRVLIRSSVCIAFSQVRQRSIYIEKREMGFGWRLEREMVVKVVKRKYASVSSSFNYPRLFLIMCLWLQKDTNPFFCEPFETNIYTLHHSCMHYKRFYRMFCSYRCMQHMMGVSQHFVLFYQKGKNQEATKQKKIQNHFIKYIYIDVHVWSLNKPFEFIMLHSSSHTSLQVVIGKCMCAVYFLLGEIVEKAAQDDVNKKREREAQVTYRYRDSFKRCTVQSIDSMQPHVTKYFTSVAF